MGHDTADPDSTSHPGDPATGDVVTHVTSTEGGTVTVTTHPDGSYDVQIHDQVRRYDAAGHLTSEDGPPSAVPWDPSVRGTEHQDYRADGTGGQTITWTDSAGTHHAVPHNDAHNWTETITAPDGTITVNTHTWFGDTGVMWTSHRQITLPDGTTITEQYTLDGTLTEVTTTAEGTTTWTDAAGQHTLTPNGDGTSVLTTNTGKGTDTTTLDASGHPPAAPTTGDVNTTGAPTTPPDAASPRVPQATQTSPMTQPTQDQADVSGTTPSGQDAPDTPKADDAPDTNPPSDNNPPAPAPTSKGELTGTNNVGDTDPKMPPTALSHDSALAGSVKIPPATPVVHLPVQPEPAGPVPPPTGPAPSAVISAEAHSLLSARAPSAAVAANLAHFEAVSADHHGDHLTPTQQADLQKSAQASGESKLDSALSDVAKMAAGTSERIQDNQK